MTVVIQVSKQGKDVLSGTLGVNDYIFDSNKNTFKILASGTVGGTITSSPTTFTAAHGQGTIVAAYAFAKFPDGYVTLPDSIPRNSGAPINRYWNMQIDNTNLNFLFYKGTASNYSATVSYYVFEAPL